MEKNTKPLISFKNFGFQYRTQTTPTLHDINLDIYKGEKVLIVGPSGSGKSTMANCINGLVPFNYSGEITGLLEVGGIETKKSSIFELSNIVGTVLQDPDGQFVGLTAAEDIAFSLENNCVPQEEMFTRVKNAAELVGAQKYLNSSPFDLSGGQKQRVSMAGVIINDVDVLLFDEPLANLDPATGKQTIELIDTIMHKTDATVVIIEHRLEDVLWRYVDRIVLVHEGKIVTDATPDEILSTNKIQECGVREPLYITALKYAGVKITPDKKPGQIDTLKLSEPDKQAVQSWMKEIVLPAKPTNTEELLKVEKLSFEYDEGAKVLDDISFSIHKGEMMAIVGTNGAGKSTLAKLICGFEEDHDGEIYVHGKSMTELTIAERARHIGYVMQNPNQMISKTMIYDEVALGLMARNIPEEEIKERVLQTLKVCGLYQFRNWPISALSFGQKKRVTIASVLVIEPEIIILDEPTAGQDFRHYTDIMEFLRNLNQNGVTVLMITHDMHLMLEYAPRAIVFSQGKLLTDATAAEVLSNPDLTKKASLKQTSLFTLAEKCNILEGKEFVQHFIDYDREVRQHG